MVIILWVNMHGSYIIGLGIAGVYLLAGVFRFEVGKLKSRGLDREYKRVLLLSLAAAVAAVLVNPNTYHMLAYPFQTVGSTAITSNVQEWLAPDFHQFRMKLFLAYAMFVYGVMAVSRKAVYVDELVNLLVFTGLSLFAARNLALLVFISLPVLARHLSGLQREKNIEVRFPLLNAAILGAIIITAVVFWPTATVLEEHTDQGEFPEQAVAYLKRKNLKGNVFNEYDWGGYLLWTRHPDNRVFVDGRADIYADKVIPDYLKIMAARKDSYAVFARYKADYVLLRRGRPFARALAGQKEWREIYSDGTAVLFARVSPPDKGLQGFGT